MTITQKIKNVLKKVNAIALCGLLVAGGLAVGFKAPERDSSLVTWVRDSSGTWQELNGRNYTCTGAQQLCSADFPEGVDANENPEEGIPVRTDGFAVIAP